MVAGVLLPAAAAAALPNAPAAISDSLISIGMRSSYKVGACRIMAAVPSRTAVVKIHKKSRSSTMATYFQSSRTCVRQQNNKMRITHTDRECMGVYYVCVCVRCWGYYII